MEYVELKNLYEFIEEHAYKLKYPHQKIGDLFQKLRDKKIEDKIENEAQKAQWEIDCFNFYLQDGYLKPWYTTTDEKGHPIEYPSLANLTDNNLDYITERLSKTSNPILKARYAHILWESPRKHLEYAKAAVDAYLELIKYYIKDNKRVLEEHFVYDLLDYVKSTFVLCIKINYRVDDILSDIRKLVIDYNQRGSSEFLLKLRIIEYILETMSKIPEGLYEGFPTVCIDLAKYYAKEGGFHQAIEMYEAGKKIDNRLGINSYDWNRGIAESYEGLMHQRDDSDLAKSIFCQYGMEYYRKIKDEEKINELEKIYEELKGKQRYQEFGFDLDQTKYLEACKEYTEKLCNEEPETIIMTLIHDKSFIPKYIDMEKRAEDAQKNTVLLKIAPISINDQRGHTAQHFATEDEKRYYRILEQYGIELKMGKLLLINETFLKAIKEKKLDFYAVMEFFERNSWYGKNIKKFGPNGNALEYNWLNLIAPSLNEYFNQVQAYLSSRSVLPNCVLAMDSLTLKIEGLIRDICVLSGIPTFFQTKDNQGRNIVREKDINALIREEPVKQLFDEDDLLFFKFVLVEKAGINLRHKIAHCLMYYQEYNISNMHLLMLILLKLGKYDFVEDSLKE